MARRTRLSRPPHIPSYPELNQYLWQIHNAINDLPNFSITSLGNVDSSNYTGQAGDIVIDLAGGEAHLWMKHDDSGSTYHWEPMGLAGYDVLYSTEENAAVLEVTPSAYSTFPAPYTYGLTGSISAVTGDEAYFMINSEGTYQIAFQSSFTADTNTKWDFDLFKNGSSTSFGAQRGIGASSLPGSASFFAIVNGSSGDSFDVRAKHDNVGAKALTTLYSQFMIDKKL